MTREEASEILSDEEISCLIGKFHGAKEALDLAFTTLRPVSRERVEKVWRGEWITPTIIGGRAYNIPHCSACNGVPCGTDEHTRFCAHCGVPMTDEAVEMVMEKINNMEEMTNEH